LVHPVAACLFSDVPDGFVEFCRTDFIHVFAAPRFVAGDCVLRMGGTMHARPLTTSTNLGDPNGDGCVTEDDVGYLATCMQGPCSQAGPCMCSLDFDRDRDVDLADVAELQRRF